MSVVEGVWEQMDPSMYLYGSERIAEVNVVKRNGLMNDVLP